MVGMFCELAEDADHVKIENASADAETFSVLTREAVDGAFELQSNAWYHPLGLARLR